MTRTRSALVLARRYAQALLDATGDLELDDEQTRGLLATAAHVLGAEAELRRVLEDPRTPPDARRSLLETLCGGTPDDHVVPRLLEMLAARRRLDLVAEIDRAFGRLWRARHGVVAAEAVAAMPLSSDQIATLTTALEAASGRRVELTTRTDPHLVGGVMLRIGGRVFDGSVRARLRSLRAALGPTATAH